jgi:serine/threonine protein phosphatase PrpC
MMILRIAAVSDRGLAREINEDAVHAGSALIAVADGMGGLPAGEVASEIAIRSLAALDTVADESAMAPAGFGTGNPTDALRIAVERANRLIGEAVEADPSLSGMGTTLTAMLLAGDRIAMVHVGDSRAYLLRDGVLTQITKDDTFVQSLVDKGAITAAEARRHPQRSLVTQAVQGREMRPVYTALRPHGGDRFLLCSDGLTDFVDDDAITEALTRYADRQLCAERLVELALRAGGPDNVSAIVADAVVVSESEPLAAGR